MNAKEGGSKYRLPTEAEWEYSARAGTKTKYYWGNTIDNSYLYYEGSSGKGTANVGQKKPNAFGLYDMCGNVWEWVQDIFDETYYNKSPANHPTGSEPGTYRLPHGGSWFNDGRLDRVSYRYYNLGFRLVKTQ